MGRYSTQLAPQLADLGRVRAGQRVLDVGCGPGALTAELVRRVGEDMVSAVDPSEPFVAAALARHPGVDVHVGSAEHLPFADAAFDATLAQLVVHFMADPVVGLRRDEARDEARRDRDRVRVGPRRRAQPAGGVLAGRSRARSRRARRVRPRRCPRGAPRWAVRRGRADLDPGDDRHCLEPSSRPSPSGGSRSRSASGRLAPMRRRSTKPRRDLLRETVRAAASSGTVYIERRRLGGLRDALTRRV